MPKRKQGNPERVRAVWAQEALERAKRDRVAAFSCYVQIVWQQTGNLAPGCDNRDLQAWYDREEAAGRGPAW